MLYDVYPVMHATCCMFDTYLHLHLSSSILHLDDMMSCYHHTYPSRHSYTYTYTYWMLSLIYSVDSRESFVLWCCERHNEVNEKLGLPTWPCNLADLDKRWLTGNSRCWEDPDVDPETLN